MQIQILKKIVIINISNSTKCCQLRLYCVQDSEYHPKYFCIFDIFDRELLAQGSYLFLCTTRHYCFVFQKKFQVFFSTCFYKKTFQVFFST